MPARNTMRSLSPLGLWCNWFYDDGTGAADDDETSTTGTEEGGGAGEVVVGNWQG